MTGRDPYRLELVTHDSVVFSVQLASPVLRAFALVIDLLVVTGTMSIVRIALMLFHLLGQDMHDAVFGLVTFGVSIGYFILLEWGMGGQTLGKKIMGLRVLDESSSRLMVSQIVVRNLFRVLDAFPFFYFTGGVVAMCNRRFQRLGDLAAGTLVIRTHKHALPPIHNLSEVKYNSLRDFPRLENQLRKQTVPDEAALLVRALLRRSNLDPRERVRLFTDLAKHFKEKLPECPEEFESMSDEVFLRNCVDTLYRNRREM